MEIKGELLRGHTDAIILSILEKSDNYGYQINTEIQNISNGLLVLTEATMYTCFKRLETQGYISSYWQDGIYVKRKYYSITEEGKTYLNWYRNMWKKTKNIVDEFIGGKE